MRTIGLRRDLKARKLGLLALAQAWLPVLTAVIGALWGLILFINNQQQLADQANALSRKESASRWIEARKPFLEKQLSVYFEITQTAGKIVSNGDPRLNPGQQNGAVSEITTGVALALPLY
jgi:hypothetical protein